MTSQSQKYQSVFSTKGRKKGNNKTTLKVINTIQGA